MQSLRPGARGSGAALAAGVCALLGLALWIFHAPLQCIADCYVDLEQLHGKVLGSFELNDTRLNSWILAWVQHALATNPSALFDANAFYPARAGLAGSEHLIGLALPTLPLRLFTDSAVALHQAVVVLSAFLLATTSLAAVRWLTGSTFAGVVAGACAILMPWRVAELTHVQLLGAHWFPLVWLLALRISLGEGASGSAIRRDAVALSLMLALQLLSSYYLAYLLTVSVGLIVAIGLLAGRSIRPLLPLALAAAPAYGLLAVLSIPYLGRESRGELFATLDPDIPTHVGKIADAWLLLAPRFDTIWWKNDGIDPTFFVPLSVALLALSTFALLGRRSEASPRLRRARVGAAALWTCVLGAFVLSIGSRILVGDTSIELPGYWMAKLVPGYSNVRAPHRWGIAIGIALPLLAGLGLAALERAWPHRRLALRALAAALLFVNLPWRALPARQAWEHPERIDAAYGALAALPPGPVLEIPWSTNSLKGIDAETRYMLASTRHWRPIANGFTAYLPPSYRLLRRMAQRLPDPEVLDRMARLADFRWIVVHTDALPPEQLARWLRAGRDGRLRLAHAGTHHRIYEIERRADTAVWMSTLVDSGPRQRSLSGLSREPLELAAGSGQLAAAPPAPLHYLGTTPIPQVLEIEVSNSSQSDWPGLDDQSEGLVTLRYTFSDQDGVAKSRTAELDTDVPAGSKVAAFPVIAPPTRSGSYLLCLDLVQQVSGQLRALPLEPVALEAVVRGIDRRSEGAVGRLAAAYRDRGPDALENGVSPCARQSLERQ